MKFTTVLALVFALLAAAQAMLVEVCFYPQRGCRGTPECHQDYRYEDQCYPDELEPGKSYTFHTERGKLCKNIARNTSCTGRTRKLCGTIGRCLPNLNGPGTMRISILEY